MTLYINPVRRVNRRQMMRDRMRDWDEDYATEIRFPMDVIADPDSFTLRAFLPGVHPDDLSIHIVNESVTISGEIKLDRDDEDNYLLAELPGGKFYRVITLPTALDANKVEADLENGILTVKLPKAEEAKPRTIKINQK